MVRGLGRYVAMVEDAQPVPMERQQAVATLDRVLAAMFPYPNSGDDPDRGRAQDQDQAYEALRILSQPPP